MSKGEEQETTVIEHLQCGDVGSALVVGGGRKFCVQKRILFPCTSEKGANFVVESS